jgi:TPR repeat protein
MAAGRLVPMRARYDDPAPESELDACATDCRAGNYYHCYRVAESYRQGKGAKRDLRRAGEFFAAACRLEPDAACNQLWELYRADRRVDPRAALEVFEASCNPQGNGFWCFTAAQAYENGWGVPRDRARALRHHAHLCKLVCGEGAVAEKKSCERHDPSCQAVVRLARR